jgi:hypothetical protein
MTSMCPHMRPLSLPIALVRGVVTALNWRFVGPVGLEPTTRGLKVRCSAS